MKENKSQIIIYKTESGKIKIDVRLQGETVWLTQLQLSELFGKSKKTISEHIGNLFKEGELIKNSVVRKFRTTAQDGKLYNTNFYNLDVIISVGYRVKSKQGTQFRIWAIERIKEYIIKGFALNENEIKLLGLLVEQYLAFAETMALENKPMYMKDWINRLDIVIKLNGKELLTHVGKISHQQAVEKSNKEFVEYTKSQKQIEIENSLNELEQDVIKLSKEIDDKENIVL